VGVLVALPAALVLAERSRVGVEWSTLRMRWRARHEPT
jgi:hypothetical protein